jgi:formate dehydrogenase iron-sulfur subunit
MGCRGCQVACKQAHGLKSDRTRFFAKGIGYQNPLRFSPANYNYVSFQELEDARGGPQWVFAKHQCMHCQVLYCAAACPMQVYHRKESGEVLYEADNCVGCGACVDVCPFRVPAIDYWDTAVPQVRKCDF